MLSVADVLELLGIPLLGVIPESKAILQSANKGALCSWRVHNSGEAGMHVSG